MTSTGSSWNDSLHQLLAGTEHDMDKTTGKLQELRAVLEGAQNEQ
jgi:hypothetical protein